MNWRNTKLITNVRMFAFVRNVLQTVTWGESFDGGDSKSFVSFSFAAGNLASAGSRMSSACRSTRRVAFPAAWGLYEKDPPEVWSSLLTMRIMSHYSDQRIPDGCKGILEGFALGLQPGIYMLSPRWRSCSADGRRETCLYLFKITLAFAVSFLTVKANVL